VADTSHEQSVEVSAITRKERTDTKIIPYYLTQ